MLYLCNFLTILIAQNFYFDAPSADKNTSSHIETPLEISLNFKQHCHAETHKKIFFYYILMLITTVRCIDRSFFPYFSLDAKFTIQRFFPANN